MPEKECKYQEGVYKVQTFRTTQTGGSVKRTKRQKDKDINLGKFC
jgi:hypothetical protein